MKRIIWLTHLILFFLFVFLVYNYLNLSFLSSFYGSIAHQFSRLHVFFVHASVGCLILLSLFEIFCFFSAYYSREMQSLRWKFHHICHFSTLVTLNSGLLMQVIEQYPNAKIHSHFLGGIAVYAGLLMLSAVCRWGQKLGRVRIVFSILLLGLVINTASIGGEIYKGSGYFVN